MGAKSIVAGKPQRSPREQKTCRALAVGRHQVAQKLSTHWGGEPNGSDFVPDLGKRVAGLVGGESEVSNVCTHIYVYPCVLLLRSTTSLAR